jgi:hypothetical protein
MVGFLVLKEAEISVMEREIIHELSAVMAFNFPLM